MTYFHSKEGQTQSVRYSQGIRFAHGLGPAHGVGPCQALISKPQPTSSTGVFFIHSAQTSYRYKHHYEFGIVRVCRYKNLQFNMLSGLLKASHVTDTYRGRFNIVFIDVAHVFNIEPADIGTDTE